MVVAMISGNTLQFQYFWDFNNCLLVIFSQLNFENFWLYLLGTRLFWLKIVKKNYNSTLKVCELTVWVKPLSTNPTKWSNTLKQFISNLPTNCLSVFDLFVKFALKELSSHQIYSKMLRQFRKPNPNFIRVIKNLSFNQSFI